MYDTLAGDEFSEDFLAHYGVKGMRWGVTRGESAGPSRSALRDMDKVARKENKLERLAESKARDAEIRSARSGLKEATLNYKAAKQTYKIEKRQIGKVAARRAITEAGKERAVIRKKAQEMTAQEKKVYSLVMVGPAIASPVG